MIHRNLKTAKEIAAETGRGRTYVQGAKKAMIAAGIPWPCNMMDTDSFLAWCAANQYRCTKFINDTRRKK